MSGKSSIDYISPIKSIKSTKDDTMKVSIFIKNTVILVATGLILRMIGMFFRIYLAEKIGAEGMGLYQLVFSVYMFASTFAASGISTAVTRLIAEHEQDGRKGVEAIMRKAVYVTLSVAVLSSLTVYTLSGKISQYLIKDIRAGISLKILSFSLPFMGLSSCLNGYFIARRKTLEPSLVTLFKQAVRIGVIIAAISFPAEKGLKYTTAAVLLGDTIAEISSFSVNFALYRADKRRLLVGKPIFGIGKRILHIALPISGSGYLSSLLHTAENILVPLRLSRYYPKANIGLELFGKVRGMALPLLFFPAAFISSMSTMLIPEISSAVACKNCEKLNRTATDSVNITTCLSIAAASVFLFNGSGIGALFYNDKAVGKMLGLLAPTVPFMYLETVTSGLLKGLDCQYSQLKYNTFDSAIRIFAVATLLPIFGIKGYIIIMTVSNIFTSSMSILCLKRRISVDITPLKTIIMPMIIGIAGGLLGKAATANFANGKTTTVISIAMQLSIFAVYFAFKNSISVNNKKNIKSTKKADERRTHSALRR